MLRAENWFYINDCVDDLSELWALTALLTELPLRFERTERALFCTSS